MSVVPFLNNKKLTTFLPESPIQVKVDRKSRQNVTNDIKTDYTVSMMSATDDYIVFVVVVDDVSYI